MCFDREVQILVDQVAFLFSRVGDIVRAMSSNSLFMPTRKRQRVEKFIRWDFPKEGWVCLDTDGASKGNPGLAGAGGMIWGYMGELYKVFASNYGNGSCMKAELFGEIRGFAIA